MAKEEKKEEIKEEPFDYERMREQELKDKEKNKKK